MKKTEKRYEIFAREYLVDLNATRAAIAAGYGEKSAAVTGCRLLRKANVQAKIRELTKKQAEKLDLKADRVLQELMHMGFSNMLDYMTVEDGVARVDLSKVTREQAGAIQEVVVDECFEGEGEEARKVRRTKFKLADKRASLELLGKYLKLFNDRVDHEHSGEIACKVIHISGDLPVGS